MTGVYCVLKNVFYVLTFWCSCFYRAHVCIICGSSLWFLQK